MNKDYVGKWLYFPWLKNNQLDHLIHPDDLLRLEGLGIVECIGLENDFLIVRDKSNVARVKTDGLKRILPTPLFKWNDMVFEISNPEKVGKVEDFFWHHKRETYLYYLSFDGKKKSRQYQAFELQLK